MSILVIGANGGVGSKVLAKLQADGQDVTAGVRNEDQLNTLKDSGRKAVLIDVEHDDIETLTEKMNGFDKVLFSVGSGGSTGADKTIIVDLDGAIKTIEASKANNVSQYVMVSTFDSRRQAFDDNSNLKPYTIAKHYADEYLKESGLNYTIVHPGTLKDDPGSGKIESEAFFDKHGEISREDVAAVLEKVLTDWQGHNSEFQIINGDTEIATALEPFNK